MHYLMLVTIHYRSGESSLQARQRAYEALLIDTTFVSEDCRFASPLADWFVIGGRWSGVLLDAQAGSSVDDTELGADADARLLSPDLYTKFLGGFEEPLHRDGDHCHFVDLDDEPCNPSFVGRKWLVVVDYHS